MRPILAVAAPAALAVLLSGCRRAPEPVDLLGAGERLVEASAAGAGRETVLEAAPRGLRLNDVVRRGFPAGPPSRLRFALDIPKGARLQLACAVDPRFHERPGVEFVVKVVRDGREEVVLTQSARPDRAGRAPRLGARWTSTSRSRPARTRAGARDPRLRAAGRSAARLLGRARDHRRRGGAARHRLPRRHPARRPHRRPTATRATPPPSSTPSRRTRSSSTRRSRTPPGRSRRWPRSSPRCCPGQHRAVQLRDPLDRLARHARRDAATAKGFATGAAIANSVIYGAGVELRPRLRLLRRPARRRRPAVEARGRRRAWWTRPCAFLDSRQRHAAPSSTCTPWTRTSPTRRPRPSTECSSPTRPEQHPGRDPRTDYKEPLDRERMIAQYDGDVAYGDREFGRFLRELKARGLYDRALIVFLADHGEEFLDHGQWLHGRSVFDELVRIPLRREVPAGSARRARGSRSRSRASTCCPPSSPRMDLPVPRARRSRDGRCRRRWPAGAPERAAIAEISHRGIVAHGVRTEADKYVRRFSPEEDELYFDLTKDPQEKTNVLGGRPSACGCSGAGRRRRWCPTPSATSSASRAPATTRSPSQTRRLDRAGRRRPASGRASATRSRENGRRLELRAAPQAGTAARGDLHRSARWGLRSGSRARATGGPCGRRTSTLGEGEHRPGRSPSACPTSTPRTRDGDARVNLFAPRREPRSRACSVWLVLPPGRKLHGVRRRDARAPEGARLPGPVIARWPGLVVFDLDGTLVDSGRDLATADERRAPPRWRPAAPPLPLEAVHSFVGEGAGVLIERSLRDAGLDLSAGRRCCRSSSSATRSASSTPRGSTPASLEALDALADRALAVLTNKPGDLSRRSSTASAWPTASRASGADDAGRAQARSGGPPPADGRDRAPRPAETAMVGDSRVDVPTARAAGVRGRGCHLGLRPRGAARGGARRS